VEQARARQGLTLKSGWVESEAQAAVDRYATQGIDLALRIYTTRLLGRDPKLVLHGGGNTSVKTRMPDLLGEDVAVLCVRARFRHGGDRPADSGGGPDRLLKLRTRAALTDEDMVRVQRENLDPICRTRSDLAARLPAAQIRRPYPRQRGVEPGRPAGRRGVCAEVMTSERASALCHAGSLCAAAATLREA
jgi:hypothetical protein